MSVKQLGWLFLSFSGRLSRVAYLLAALLMTVILTFLLYRTMLAEQAGVTDGGVWNALFSLAIFASLWAQAALGIKRIHDIGRPAIFALVLFLPLINAIAFIALCIIPGEPGPNRYGQVTNAPA